MTEVDYKLCPDVKVRVSVDLRNHLQMDTLYAQCEACEMFGFRNEMVVTSWGLVCCDDCEANLRAWRE